MNIHFNPTKIANYFKESILASITAQQKKIFAIVSMALGFLAICFVARRYCLNRKAVHIKPADDQGWKVKTKKERGEFKGNLLHGEGERIKIYPDGTIEESKGEFAEGHLVEGTISLTSCSLNDKQERVYSLFDKQVGVFDKNDDLSEGEWTFFWNGKKYVTTIKDREIKEGRVFHSNEGVEKSFEANQVSEGHFSYHITYPDRKTVVNTAKAIGRTKEKVIVQINYSNGIIETIDAQTIKVDGIDKITVRHSDRKTEEMSKYEFEIWMFLKYLS